MEQQSRKRKKVSLDKNIHFSILEITKERQVKKKNKIRTDLDWR